MNRDRTPERRPTNLPQGIQYTRNDPEAVGTDKPVVVKTDRLARDGAPSEPLVVMTTKVSPQVIAQALPSPALPNARAPVAAGKKAETEKAKDRRSKEPKATKEKSKRVTQETKRSDEVRRIRDAEGRGDNSKTERARAQEARRKREGEAVRKERGATKLRRKYPRTVDWAHVSRVKLSYCSLALWLGLICVVVLLAVSIAGRQINVTPNGVAASDDSFTYEGKVYQPGAVSGRTSDGKTKALPPLVVELLSLPNKPTFDCGQDSLFNATSIQSYTAGASYESSSVTYGHEMTLTGTSCSFNYSRVGYCVSQSNCASINTISSDSSRGTCTSSSGPRRFEHQYVSSSFLESVTVFWFIPLALLGAALVVMTLWTLLFPGPFTLYLIAVVANIAVYVGWAVKLSNNFYILIYAGLVSLFVLVFYREHMRVSRILKIGYRVMQGRRIDDNMAAGSQSEASISSFNIKFPAIFVALLQLCSAYGIIYLVAFSRSPSTFNPEPVYGVQYTQAGVWVAFGLGILNTLSLGIVPDSIDKLAYKGYDIRQPYSCSFETILEASVYSIIFVLFFSFISVYLQFAAKYLVSRSVADWYFAGSKSYRPVPDGGASSVGFKSLRLSLLSEGHKIMHNGFWATIANSSASLVIGWKPFITHILISPVDAILYSFLGFLFLGFTKHKSRFGLVHSSFSMGPKPSIEISNRLSSELIRKTYGRLFAAVGDSSEFRLMSISGNLLATSIGLAAWAWMDSLQNFDSIADLGGVTIVVIWLGGSFISKPCYATIIVLLLDYLWSWPLILQAQIVKNGIMAFLIIAAIANSIIRVFLEIPTSATDAVVYCYALERIKRRRIRSLAIDEMIHKDYLGDYGMFPAGTQLERVVVHCPVDAKPNKDLLIEIDGNRYTVKVPPGAKPGRDFEAAVPIPLNNLDIAGESSPEEDYDDDYDDDDDDDVDDDDYDDYDDDIIYEVAPRQAEVAPPSNVNNPDQTMVQPPMIASIPATVMQSYEEKRF